MSMSSKLILLFMLSAIATARADGIGGGIGGANGIGSGAGDPDGVASEKINLTHIAGAIVQTDGTSLILQTDNSSSICLAGATC